MRFIVLDTADARGSVALFRNSDLFRLEAHLSDEDYSSWLLPAVHRALKPSGLSLAQLDGYAVCAGPGSFTGLRVGLTTVKAWSEIYGRPIAALSRLAALAANSSAATEVAESFVAACIDARRGQLFAGLYEHSAQDMRPIGAESVISPSEFVLTVTREAGGRAVRWRTPDPRVLLSLPEWQDAAAAGHILEAVQPPFADRLGLLAHRKLLAGDVTDAVTLDANYVRRSDAELFWKDNRFAVKP
jgi:tRNA threonylcarbamoyladenosine biosynthesis protein TsaB